MNENIPLSIVNPNEASSDQKKEELSADGVKKDAVDETESQVSGDILEKAESYPELIETLKNDDTIPAEEKVRMAEEAMKSMDIQRTELERKSKAEKQKTRQVREQLGLIGESAATVSTESYGRQIDLLDRQHQEIVRLKKKFKAEVSTAEAEKVLPQEEELDGKNSFGTEQVSEAVGRLTGALHQRKRDRLDSLLEDTDISRIAGAAEKFDALTAKKDISAEDVQDAASSLTKSLESFGAVKLTGTMNEDAESLRRLKFVFEEISRNAKEMARRVKAKEKLSNAEQSLRKVTEKADSIGDFLSKKIGLLGKY